MKKITCQTSGCGKCTFHEQEKIELAIQKFESIAKKINENLKKEGHTQFISFGIIGSSSNGLAYKSADVTNFDIDIQLQFPYSSEIQKMRAEFRNVVFNSIKKIIGEGINVVSSNSVIVLTYPNSKISFDIAVTYVRSDGNYVIARGSNNKYVENILTNKDRITRKAYRAMSEQQKALVAQLYLNKKCINKRFTKEDDDYKSSYELFSMSVNEIKQK